MVRLVAGVYFWFVFVFATLFWFAIACLAHLVAVITSVGKNGRGVHYVAGMWSRTVIAIMPGWRVTASGLELLPKGPAVLVANHESMADIWALYFLHIQFRWLSKESVFKYPIIGTAMRWAGYVPIRRGDKDSHGVAMQAAKERLHAGIAMFFFPEGTRSVDGRIKEFKTGAFRLAVENNVPIVPIALKGAGNLLPKGSWKPGRAHVSIKVLPPIAPSADIHALAIQARERIIAAHAGLGESKSGDA